jgi:hypothetical protein
LGDKQCESLAVWPHEEMEMISVSLRDGMPVGYIHLLENGLNEDSALTLLSKYLISTP